MFDFIENFFKKKPIQNPKDVELTFFNEINVDGPVTVIYERSSKISLVVDADEAILSKIEINIKNECLYIRTLGNFIANKKIKIKVSGPILTRISTQSVSRFKGKNLHFDELSVDSSGTSKVELIGKIETAKFVSKNVSKINARELNVSKAAIVSNDVSAVSICVSGFVDVHVSDVAKVSVYGNTVARKTIKQDLGTVEFYK